MVYLDLSPEPAPRLAGATFANVASCRRGAMSTLAKVLWINLDRRTDRSDAQLNALEAAGSWA